MIRSVLIANRGEIAVRIAPACAESGIRAGVVQSQDHRDAVNRARGALKELRIEDVATNAGFLLCLLDHEAFRSGDISTRFLEVDVAQLACRAVETGPPASK